jgi:hypothetical protein
MEKRKKVTGTWRGSYGYLKPEVLARSPRVPFMLVLKQGLFWRFFGTVIEDKPLGMPGTGRVEGYFSFPRIEFTKRMPIGYTKSKDGQWITLSDCLRSRQIQCDRDLPHPPIFYEGAFYDTGRIKGTWIIRAKQIQLPDGIALPAQETSGDWEIEFQSADNR